VRSLGATAGTTSPPLGVGQPPAKRGGAAPVNDGDPLANVLLSLPTHTEEELTEHVASQCCQNFETFAVAKIVWRSRALHDTIREFRKHMTQGSGWRKPELMGNRVSSYASWGHSSADIEILRLADGEFAIVRTETETS
jgi:hypothetical protein